MFHNRQEAGKALAEELARIVGDDPALTDPVVLALPRGGLPVAAEIARALDAPLDIVLVRKIGVPFQPELAAAAVVDGDDPQLVVNEDVVRQAGMSKADLERAKRQQLAEIERRREQYLKGRERAPVEGRTVIVVDDGIATGATIRAALKGLRRRKPKALILAVPVAPEDTVESLGGEVDRVVCLETPPYFYAIGAHYHDFTQVSDREVVETLDAAAAARGAQQPSGEA